MERKSSRTGHGHGPLGGKVRLAVGLLEAAGPGEAGLERRELKGTTTGLKSTSGRPGQQGGRHQTAGRSFNGRRLGLAGDCPTEMDVSNKVARIDGGLFIYLLFNLTFTCICMQLAPPTGYYS